MVARFGLYLAIYKAWALYLQQYLAIYKACELYLRQYLAIYKAWELYLSYEYKAQVNHHAVPIEKELNVTSIYALGCHVRVLQKGEYAYISICTLYKNLKRFMFIYLVKEILNFTFLLLWHIFFVVLSLNSSTPTHANTTLNSL